MNTMKRLSLLAVALILVCTAVPAAHALEGDFRVAPLVGVRLGGDVQDAETGAKYRINESEMFGLSLAAPFARNTYVEMLYSYADSDVDAGEGVNLNFGVQYLQIGWLQYMQADKLQPYAAPGLGWTHFFSDDGSVASSDRLSLNFGFGADYALTDSIGLRAGGRVYATFTSDDARAVYGGRSGAGVVYAGSVMLQADFSLGLVVVF